MTQKKQFQTRLDPDVADRVEEYADENNLSHSEAVRRLVRSGIEAADEPSRDEIAADLEEIRDEIRGVQSEIENEEEETHTMYQMDAKYVGLTGTVAAIAFYLGTVAPV